MAQGMVARDFSNQLKMIAQLTQERFDACMRIASEETLQSIKFGSTITGAPGQPVKTGDLQKSVQRRKVTAGGFSVVAGNKNVMYAAEIEYNTRNATLRSSVGGFHSFAITSLNFRLILDWALARAKGEVPIG